MQRKKTGATRASLGVWGPKWAPLGALCAEMAPLERRRKIFEIWRARARHHPACHAPAHPPTREPPRVRVLDRAPHHHRAPSLGNSRQIDVTRVTVKRASEAGGWRAHRTRATILRPFARIHVAVMCVVAVVAQHRHLCRDERALERRDVGDDARLGVTAERVAQEQRELRIYKGQTRRTADHNT